jgi:hypothetical protein
MFSYEPASAGSIGTLLNNRDQSDPIMRDAAVFASLISLSDKSGSGPVAQVVRAHP